MKQEYLLNEIINHRPDPILITDAMFNEMFSKPKKVTVEDMEHVLVEKLGTGCNLHRGEFSHVTEKSQKDKLGEFCEENNIEYRQDEMERLHYFRFKRS